MTRLLRVSVCALLLAAPAAESAPAMQVLSGTYVGDGTDDRFIYVGFEPDVVFLDRDDPSNPDESLVRTSTMPVGMSKLLDDGAGGGTALLADAVQSFDPGGFTIGTDVRVNRSSIVYHWVAFTASPGELVVGTYTGNGTSQSLTSPGFSPTYAVTISEGAHNVIQKSSAMPATFSMDFIATGYTNAIDGFLPTGFSVGSSTRANSGGTVYHYAAWASLPGRVAVGTYNGDATDNRNINAPGFFPEWVIVNRSSNAAGGQANSPVHKPASTGVTTDRALLLDNNLGEANNIQRLTATGFQVGSHTRVNDTAAPNFYHWMAFGPHRPQINYRSIGTNAANLHPVGMASVPLGSRIATFTSSLPAQTAVGAIGIGDSLVIQGETLYIEAYLSPTQVLLQSAATVDHSTPTSTFTVRRAYNTLSAWETARGGDLVGQDRNEVGVAYKDGPFQETLTIDATSSDATRFMRLTVAPGQRHNGTGATGATLDGQYADRLGIEVLESNTIVEWLEVTNHGGSTGFPSVRVEAATNVLFQYLLVRDFPDPSGNTEGIAMKQGEINGMTVRNSMIYNGDAVGIEGDDADDTLIIENCTIYNMDGEGISEKSGTPIVVRNTIAMGNAIDFDITVGGAVEEYNMSEDNSANCGVTCKPLSNPAIQFVSAGTNHHLAGTSTAIDAGVDRSSSFCCDIDTAARTGLWDIGADEFGAATAVNLVAFEGTGEDGSVLLEWETGSELDNLGFHLYRAPTAAGPFERITASPIPGLGASPTGAKYRHTDAGLANGVTYLYRLEDIDTYGRTTSHGPIAVTPRESAEPSPPPVELADTESSLVTFGAPEESAFRVVERDRSGITLELVTGGFYAVAGDDGSVRLEVPGLESPTEPGVPGLPVKRSWVDAVAGRNVAIQTVWKDDVATFSGITLGEAALPELEAFANGTVRAGRRRRSAQTGWARDRIEGLYPRESARLVSVGFQGDVKKALVELAPLRWDAATGRVELAGRVRVRLSFRGRDLDDAVERDRRSRRELRAGGSVIARLGTREPGLYGVRFEDVLAGRARSTGGLRLSRQGATVPYYLDAPRFGPGATLYFVSEGEDSNPFGREAVYELELGAAGALMPELSGAPGTEAEASQTSYRHRVTREENLQYQPALVDAPDLWLWDVLFAPVKKSYSFDVTALASSGAESVPPVLSLWFQGASDFTAHPDHHLRVYVNGTFVAESRWDGKAPRAVEVELPPGVLFDGTNQLELENVGDTGASYSMFLLNRFTLEYSRRTVAQGGELRGRFVASGTATLSGFSAGAKVVDTSGATHAWVAGARSSTDGTFLFAAEAGHDYLVVSPERVARPSVAMARSRSSRWTDGENRADYLVIGPSELLSEAAPLLSLREEQGLSVAAVPVEDIYDEFGYGEPTPEAIKRFLTYAYHEWQRPAPRYVLLLGDATYDFKGMLGASAANRVPPRMVRTSYLWTASDSSYAAVNGDDILPDMALGRLPAATVDELRVMVSKILAFESKGGIDGDAFVLVADNPDVAGDFVADADALAATVLASRHPDKIYLSALGLSATRSAIAERFDRGASLVSYIGHGGIHVWADENLLDTSGVDSLGAQSSQPLLLTMNCLNGYFHFPWFDSLAEALVKADSKGAVAAFSPSGLSLDEPANLYHRALLEALVEGGYERLGDAVLDAQASYAETGAFPELLSIYNLLGDPALEIR